MSANRSLKDSNKTLLTLFKQIEDGW